jgi:8-oxo-dGTP pyrophosphatase MutT (NUDIX family)
LNRFLFKSAVHLFLIQDEKILLSRRYHTGYEDGKYSVVAGHLDGGERVVSAAVREAREEVGIIIQPRHIEVVGVMHRLSEDERFDFFVVTDEWQGSIRNMEPDKCDDLSWFPLEGLPENMVPYVRKAIQNYLSGIWFDSFGWEK